MDDIIKIFIAVLLINTFFPTTKCKENKCCENKKVKVEQTIEQFGERDYDR